MKLMAAIGVLVVFAFLSVAQAEAEVATFVLEPQVNKGYGPLKPGTIVRLYCYSPDGILSGTYGIGHLGKIIFPLTAGSKLTVGYLISVNIYCAPTPNGPWRWLRQTTDLKYALNIDSEKEVGYSARAYRIDIACYQSPGDPSKNFEGACANASLYINPPSPIANISGSTPGVAKQESRTQKVSSGKPSDKDLEANGRSIRGIANSAKDLATNVRNAQGATNLVYVKALVDSVKAFVDSVKTEKELARQVSALTQSVDAVGKHLSGPFLGKYEALARAGKSPPAEVIEKTDKLLEELSQALEILAEVGKNLPREEKLSKSN